MDYKPAKPEDRKVTQRTRPLIQATTRGLPQKQANQDAVDVFRGNRVHAVALADGVGSALDADRASAVAVRAFLAEIAKFDSSKDSIHGASDAVRAGWGAAFSSVADVKAQDEQRYSAFNKAPILETTLITVVDVGDRYLFSYVGNGSIWYVRGDFDSVAKVRWPWAIVNLAVGQAVLNPATGKDELEHVISPSAEPPIVFVDHSKNAEHGEVVILCSDGISSEEQRRIGNDNSNKLWTEVNDHLIDLVTVRLPNVLAAIKHTVDPEVALSDALRHFLEERSFDDDASVSVLISDRIVRRCLDAV